MFPHFKWNGGLILIQNDRFQEAIDWYSTHMGWVCKDRIHTFHGEKAFFPMPGGGQIVLKAVDSTHEHLNIDDVYEGQARFCFAVGDWERTLQYFSKHHIPMSEPKLGPDECLYSDLVAFDNARITIVEQKQFERKFLDSRIVSYANVPVRFGVTNLEASSTWYGHFLGLIPAERHVPDGFSLLKGKSPYQDVSYFGERVWLEQVEAIPRRTNPSVRPYFYLDRETFLDVTNVSPITV